MASTTPPILAIHGGSSSIKFALFEASEVPGRSVGGTVERRGLWQATLEINGPHLADHVVRPVKAPDHAAAVNILIDEIQQRRGDDVLVAVGHRAVQGGPNYSAPPLITDALVEDVRRLFSFDPEHPPEEVWLIEAVRRWFHGLPQIACFDTGFPDDLPRVAPRPAIPPRYKKRSVRRYGFHGLSYDVLMGELADTVGAEAAQGRINLAHPGNGASLAAVHHGPSIDASMGFTPTCGVLMATRSGDIDHGSIGYLAQARKTGARQRNTMTTPPAGLRGVSQTRADLCDLPAAETGAVRAAKVIVLFCHRISQWTGAFAAALGGLDTVVLAGATGESAPAIRQRICDGLGFPGVELDPQRDAHDASLISTAAGRVQTRVIHTDEEIVIAKSAARLLHLHHGTPAHEYQHG
ncbi:hypothetical protein PY254_07850 [Rhodanobacter sp. AS-Z3]|uniref:acetate/propionate family kinase n=1 Tax=Rhodanobacter sp. AS-Z3 TaxID=3031330 RepID=UPI00247ADF74|nr:hypothetical protein [Rhodanobacter sp. AS-Z3]WEN16566.1 hypothetical protein PY254_07850 [Rhodanobacter sp. AS-Z3]